MINWMEGRMRLKVLDSYTLKQLNHWLKSKNKQNISENDVILLNTGWRFPPPGLKSKTVTHTNLLRRVSTHNLSPKTEAEAKAKDKFKAFYSILVPFVSP